MKGLTYPKYKMSGIEWLGEIPEHWEIWRLKHLCKRSALYGANEPADSYASEGARFLRTTDITDDGKLIGEGVYLPMEAVREYLLEEGDILFSRSGTIGRSFQYRKETHGPCAYAGYLVRFVPGPILNPSFAFYFSKSKLFERWLAGVVISSTIGNVNGKKFANLELPCPSFKEQHAISVFLNREASRIDGLIEKKRRQIELLQEKRQALISHAVTKGLNPNAKMKDSGIEWLGEIPEHWVVRKLKHIAAVNFSSVDKHSVEGEKPVHLCNYVDVYYNDYITPDIAFMEATATQEEIWRFTLKRGDVLVTKDSEEWNDIAVSAYVADELQGVVCGYHLAHIRANPVASCGEYIFRAFSARGINDQFRVEATGITRYGLSKYALDNSLFPVPPFKEQRAISAFLDRETSRIDMLINKVEESMETLREYRTALISAAVTGKIDVRGVKV